jgi:hypothetical protein
MRLRLPSAFEMHARRRGWLAGWLHGEMLLHHNDVKPFMLDYDVNDRQCDVLLFDVDRCY